MLGLYRGGETYQLRRPFLRLPVMKSIHVLGHWLNMFLLVLLC